MTRMQAAQVMTVLANAFAHKLSDDELEVWFNAVLERCDFELGQETAWRLVREDAGFWPRPARFEEVRRAIRRSREPEQPQLDGGAPVSVEEGRQWVERVRETIANAPKAPQVEGVSSVGQVLRRPGQR